jgi:cation diffusion facilitator CzcD-associated flavoprotein CzcO
MSPRSVDNETLVIGAGPAGLAVGACLKRANLPCTILEQNERVASSWGRHYDRLHLHTDKNNSELPFMSFPGEYPRFPSRLQVIDYLHSYAEKFDLDIWFNQHVISAQRQGGAWQVQTQDSFYEAPNLVIAAGYNREPFVPNFPGRNLFNGRVLHSSQYENGEPFKGQSVLVVGFGNSGGEIAIDLCEYGANPGISVRSAVNVIPRELFGIPILSIGILQNKLPAKLADAINAPILRTVIGDITNYGLRKLPYGPVTQIREDRHIPLIDVGTIQLIREGKLATYAGVQEFTKNGILFTDGKESAFDAVILATGYRPRVNEFLHPDSKVYDEEGTPISSGRESSVPGLYFCGYYVSPTGMLREIGMEARRISKLIASRGK